MIVYFDTSAIVPLIVGEPSTPACLRLWNDTTRAVSTRLLYPEASAALARAERMGRMTPIQHDEAVSDLDELVAEIDHIELTMALARIAGDLARSDGLRGYDAVHLAAALSVSDTDVVMATGDHDLAAAARAHGLTVARTS